MGKQIFVLAHQEARRRAVAAVSGAPDGFVVRVEPPKRTLDQNAKFHAICGDLEESGLTWANKRRTRAQWKVLLVSGHAVVTGEGSEMIPGLEGEFVNVRESTAEMGKRRGSSLIEYAVSICVLNNVEMREYAKMSGRQA